MNYSLGNMLKSGGALNPDGLSLDLAFALDKTLTARKGPTPSFTRTQTSPTGSTYIGADGLIKYAAANEPRFDHDPSTGVCRGLLIEESRQNALQHSSDFKNTTSSNYWENLSATTVTVNQTTSPDGGVNADLLTTSTASFDCFARRNGIFAGSTQYTYSIFLKRGPSNHRYVGLYIGVGITSTRFPFFDFNNPTTVQIPSGTMVGAINSTRVDAYQNGWYRVSVTFTTAATPVTSTSGVYIAQSNGELPSSSAAGLDAYIWGIQVEAGAFPTSYIPTTTTALTRSADVCSITGGAFTSFYNQSEGTILSLASQPVITSGNALVYAVDSGGDVNRHNLRHQSSIAVSQFAGSTTSLIDFSDPTENVVSRIAYTYATTNYGGARNGTLGTSNPNTTVPTVTQIFFGSKGHNSTEYLNGHIARIQYFRKRLPNAKLQTLTAP